jgi:Leucine-rich repeat (LRR) protein
MADEEGGAAAEVEDTGPMLDVALHIKAGENLKGIAKTVDGAGFAFTSLDLPGTDAADDGSGGDKFANVEALKDYLHLRYVNLSNHIIKDPGPLAAMAHLLSLNLSKNQLTTESLEKFKEAPLKFLQVLDLSHNRIEEYAVDFPMLRELYLNNNQLSAIKLNAEGCVLKKLDVRDNKPLEPPPEVAEGEEPPPPKGLLDCDGYGMPSLEELLVTGNPIKSLKGLDTLTGVQELDLSGTDVENLDGLPAGGKLRKLLMRDCKIAAWEEMDKLKEVTTLKDLDVQGNPLPPGGSQRGRILMRVPTLETLDELPITDEDREAAKEGDPEPPPAE